MSQQSPPADPPSHAGRTPGRYLGRYELRELLERAAALEVYRAFDPDSQRHVAVRVLRQPGRVEPQVVARFERAASALAALKHPGIVPLLDSGVVDDRFYVVTPLVDGESVRDLLDRHRQGLAQREAVSMAWQVAGALAFAHKRGVVHGDVRSAHILVTSDGRALLTGFSPASALEGGALTSTPAYASPEQAGGAPPTAQSDLYALGVTLYEMVTGRVPFGGVDAAAVLEKHLREPPVPPRDVGAAIEPALEAIIMRLLEKSPGARYDSAAAVRAALQSEADTGKYRTLSLRGASLREAGDDETLAQLQQARQAKRAKRRKRTGPLGGLLDRLRGGQRGPEP